MKRRFTKMHGCMNDYIYFDCLRQPIEHPEELAVRLSDRHASIGGDGVVLICPSETADARMRMFNADGSEGKMCGNATRCIGKYLYERAGMRKDVLTLETLSGIKTLRIHASEGVVESVTVDMGAPELQGRRIPVCADGTVIRRPLSVGGREYEATCVSMGNPHCVIFTGDPGELDLPVLGPQFENHPFFPERVNTEFVQVLDGHTLQMRVWERGSGETLACGTGACASAVAAVLCGYCPKGETITVRLRGGDLRICWNETVTMEGPAVIAFDGETEI